MKTYLIIAANVVALMVILLLALNFMSSGKLVYKKTTRTLSDLNSLSYAIETYKEKYNEYPTTEEGISRLIDKDILIKNPRDPWGSIYRYSHIDNNHYKLYSIGSNGLDENGGGDDIQIRIETKNSSIKTR